MVTILKFKHKNRLCGFYVLTLITNCGTYAHHNPMSMGDGQLKKEFDMLSRVWIVVVLLAVCLGVASCGKRGISAEQACELAKSEVKHGGCYPGPAQCEGFESNNEAGTASIKVRVKPDPSINPQGLPCVQADPRATCCGTYYYTYDEVTKVKLHRADQGWVAEAHWSLSAFPSLPARITPEPVFYLWGLVVNPFLWDNYATKSGYGAVG
jgi:hypothetical protein